MPALPTVWYTKNINPTVQRLRQVMQSGRYRVVASHTSSDASYLGAAHQSWLEPTPVAAPEYLDYVLETVKTRGINAVVAGRYAAHLAAHRAEFAALDCHLIVPSRNPKSFEMCEDKTCFYGQFAERIPMPETRAVRTWSAFSAAAHDLAVRHGSACFKPARGIFGIGFRILSEETGLSALLSGDQLTLSYAAAELMLGDLADIPQPNWPELLVMQTLSGTEYSVDALARRGELLTCVVRGKISGLGNLQISVDSAQLRDWTALLARELEMDGLFNAQFKEDASGLPRLLEVNARASGGLPISSALSGLALGLLEVDSHFDVPLGDLSFATGRRVTETREVIVLPS